MIYVDLKMMNFLLSQQSSYTKHPCFLCMWDSRAKEEHYTKKEWPSRELKVGEKNVINEALASRDKIISLLLHIKLGCMKQFVKVLNKGDCFKCICKSCPGLSAKTLKVRVFDRTAKTLKARVFDRTNNRKFIKDAEAHLVLIR